MASTLSAHEQRVADIFSDNYAFQIPGYQRPYSWTTVEAGELLDDIWSFMGDQVGPVEAMTPYFMGSIVLIKTPVAPDADVIDGQQRLTTLTLLLAVLRRHVAGDDAATLTTLIYQPAQALLGNRAKFRLQLRPRDQTFFLHNVQELGGLDRLLSDTSVLSDSQRRIRENAKHFDERVGALAPDDRARLAQFILTRCLLVVVATPDQDSAFRIFSVMNSRGMPLAATDILKADTIGGIPELQQDAYTDKWEAIEDHLGRRSFDDLFGHIRMIYRKQKPKGTLLSEFREHVTRGVEARALVDQIIAPLADRWRDISRAQYTSTGTPEQVNKPLRWLNRLEFSDWAPPALAFAMRRHGDEAAMATFFNSLERLSYSMLLRRRGVNERIERFSRLTAEIEAGTDLHAQGSALQLSAEERAETRAALDGPLYLSHPARARSTILLRLNNLMTEDGAIYDAASVTVEHVAPQNPPSGSLWLTWFPDAAERDLWTHRIGNLALLSAKKNSAASNYEFEHKKAVYLTKNGVTPFALTTQVASATEWTPAIVAGRQEALLKHFSDHWKLL